MGLSTRWQALAAGLCETVSTEIGQRRTALRLYTHVDRRHPLASGTPLNELSVWLGHRSIETTLVYLQLLPDPTGRMEAIP